MERLARKDKIRSLKDFTYTDGDIAGEIYAAMNSTSFLGVSVRFDHIFSHIHILLVLWLRENFTKIQISINNFYDVKQST